MNDEYNFERMLIIGAIAVIVIIGLITSGNKNGAPDYSTDSHNISIETHETNIDICGICINSDR